MRCHTSGIGRAARRHRAGQIDPKLYSDLILMILKTIGTEMWCEVSKMNRAEKLKAAGPGPNNLQV